MRKDEDLKKQYAIKVNKEDRLIEFNYKIGMKPEEKEDMERLTELIRKDVFNILSENKNIKFDMVVDFVNLGQTKSTSSKVRKIWMEIGSHKSINKIAVVSESVFFKVVVGFMVKAIGKEDKIKWFNNRENAYKWILNKKISNE